MALLRRTYTLPQETVTTFEQAVEPAERSAIVARLLRDWLDWRQRIRRDVIDGCREMADVYRAIESEFHSLEEEVQRGLGPNGRPSS